MTVILFLGLLTVFLLTTGVSLLAVNDVTFRHPRTAVRPDDTVPNSADDTPDKSQPPPRQMFDSTTGADIHLRPKSSLSLKHATWLVDFFLLISATGLNLNTLG